MSFTLPRLIPAAFLLGGLLAGCATEQGQIETSAPAGPAISATPQPGTGGVIPGTGVLIPPPVVTPPLSQKYPHTIQDSGAGPAVLSLYRKAQDARAAGHPDQAEEQLERARRIEPRNPFIWQALAGTKLDLKQYDQAEEFANRSNDLARGNPWIENGNWRLIATARQQRGDSGGAVQAQNRADDIARLLSPE
jgi:tetratricopeptide (TPR) repeat protein